MARYSSQAGLRGAAELAHTLDDILHAMRERIAPSVKQEQAEELQRLLVAAAPYDPRTRKKPWALKGGGSSQAYYGHLRDQIKVVRSRSQNASRVTYRVSTGDAFWGNFVEFGTSRMAAQPWARPVIDQSKRRLSAIEVEGLRDGLSREARRARRTVAS